jgi:hypothetical protein
MQTGEMLDTSTIEAKKFGFVKPDTGETFRGWRDRVAETHTHHTQLGSTQHLCQRPQHHSQG